MQQAVEDGRSDHVVGEDRSPIAIALVARQNERALLVALAHQVGPGSRGGLTFHRKR